jgi:ribosome-binding protein aMBF1 (putative translation factor)
MTKKHQKVSQPQEINSSEAIQEKLICKFIDIINKEMKKQKVSCASLAKKMDKSRQYVHKVVNNKSNFTIKTISEFCYHLNLNPVLIFNSSSEKNLQDTLNNPNYFSTPCC